MGAGLRHGAFVLAAAMILLGPAERQVFGRRGPFHGWTMFSRVGVGMIHVEFRARDPRGVETPVDWRGVLGSGTRQLATLAAARTIATQLCRKLDPGTDLRIYARQAVRHGWNPLAAGEENACAGS